MQLRKLIGVMLAILLGISTAVFADTAFEVLTQNNAVYTRINVINRGSVTANCNIKVYTCSNGNQRGLTNNFNIPALGFSSQSIGAAGPTLTVESAELSCDQPVDAWSHVTIPANGASQAAVKAIAAGLGYFQNRAVEVEKSVSEDSVTLTNTWVFCHNPTANSETLTFTLRDDLGNAFSTSPVNVPVVSKGCVGAYIDSTTLFGSTVPTGYRGTVTMDAGSGNQLACIASMDYGNGQFVYVDVLPF